MLLPPRVLARVAQSDVTVEAPKRGGREAAIRSTLVPAGTSFARIRPDPAAAGTAGMPVYPRCRTLMKLLLLLAACLGPALPAAQVSPRYNELARKGTWPYRLEIPDISRREFTFPDAGGFRVIKGEFHIHTLYSDGQVTPETRVIEAWRDGLDVLAITDHAEYIDFVLPEHDARSFGRAEPTARRLGLTLVRGAEVSTIGQVRRPPVDSDFIVNFLKDEQALSVPFPDAMRAAREQGALNTWAHPGAYGGGDVLADEVRAFLDSGWLHGIEIYNTQVAMGRQDRGQRQVRGVWMWPQVLDWCLQYNLNVFAVSDAHWPVDLSVDARQGLHRPMTLLLARSSSPADVREALEQRRTIACFHGMLWGPRDPVEAVIRAALKVERPASDPLVRPNDAISLRNLSSLPLTMTLADEEDRFLWPAGEIMVPAHSTLQVPFKRPAHSPGDAPVALRLTVTSAFVTSKDNLVLHYKLP